MTPRARLAGRGGRRGIGHRVRRACLTIFVTLVATACGPDRGPRSWLPAETAAVHCTTAGPHPPAPVMLGLPIPRPPAGLLARGLDPISVGDLGFRRDRVACAVLEAPDAETVDTVTQGVRQLIEAQDAANLDAVTAARRCACESARALGAVGLLPACTGVPVDSNCDPEAFRRPVEQALAPLRDTLAEASLPLLHWRLVGPVGDEQRFFEQQTELLSRFDGGATVYRPGDEVRPRGNDQLVSGLLARPGVLAVVTQDAGRALLVVRRLRGDLVLDHFRHPAVSPVRLALLAAWDNAHLSDYVRALAPPERTVALDRVPGEGNLIQVDRAGLARVDALVDAAAPLAGATVSTGTATDPWVDHAVFQAPFGHEGQRLVAELRLTEGGIRWARGLTHQRLTPTLRELGLPDPPPTNAPPADDVLPHALRGRPVEAQVFGGVQRVADVFRRVEMHHPGTIGGYQDAWSFELPVADLTGSFEPSSSSSGRSTGGAMGGIVSVVSRVPMVLEASFDDARTLLTVTLRPR